MANNFSIKKNKKKRLNYLYGHLRRLNINNTPSSFSNSNFILIKNNLEGGILK